MSTPTSTLNKSECKGKKWVYLFHEGSAAMRDLLGGKGAGLSEMTNVGLPVPPGFTITTEACNAYYAANQAFADGLWEQVKESLHYVEQETAKWFGDPKNPLLVSVRSGAKFSMPGMIRKCAHFKTICYNESIILPSIPQYVLSYFFRK